MTSSGVLGMFALVVHFGLAAGAGEAFDALVDEPLRLIRERLGHATVSITLDRYSHVTDVAHRQAALAVDGLLGLSAPK